VGVHRVGQDDLPQVRSTDGGLGLLSCTGQAGEQDRDQCRQDGYDDQQLDERKGWGSDTDALIEKW